MERVITASASFRLLLIYAHYVLCFPVSVVFSGQRNACFDFNRIPELFWVNPSDLLLFFLLV